jgi:hypothetical protein
MLVLVVGIERGVCEVDYRRVRRADVGHTVGNAAGDKEQAAFADAEDEAGVGAMRGRAITDVEAADQETMGRRHEPEVVLVAVELEGFELTGLHEGVADPGGTVAGRQGQRAVGLKRVTSQKSPPSSLKTGRSARATPSMRGRPL